MPMCEFMKQGAVIPISTILTAVAGVDVGIACCNTPRTTKESRRRWHFMTVTGSPVVSQARPFFLFGGVAGSAEGKKSLVSLGCIPLQCGMQ